MNCPICGKEMTEYTDTLDGWCLMEQSYQCPDMCYENNYCTGVTEIYVKGELFFWSYTTPRNEVEAIEKQIEIAIKKALEVKA